MIASWALRIFGSGTSWTATLLRPIQHVACIAEISEREGRSDSRGLGGAFDRAAVGQVGLGDEDFARLEDRLEAPQVLRNLLGRLLAEQLRDGGAERAARGR